MKKLIPIILCLLGAVPSLVAEHIKGGELYYVYIGPGPSPNTSEYRVTLKLYIDCRATNPGQLDTQVPFTIFDKGTGTQFGDTVIARMSDERFINFDPATNPCIGNPPSDVCYRIRWFTRNVILPTNTMGYTIAYQRCCRINNIVNLTPPSNAVGVTYIAEIPGTGVLPEAYKNSSPTYVTNDAAAICIGSFFNFSFGAAEPDGTDSLVYVLCGGFAGATQINPNPPKAAPPPYPELSYRFPYSNAQPLGGQATINPQTGLITGIAPATTGQFVITACAYEYRQGVLINIHRKDIHVAVSDCIPLKAVLKPNYSYCDDFFVTFANEQLNPSGSVYIWDYGDNTKKDTTSNPLGTVNHQYLDTGTYRVQLKVILAGQCVDSTITMAKVYPGFFPGFTTTGTCVLLPLQFNDTTASRYGAASKWSWNFGDETTNADTSSLKNPSWKYNSIGVKQVRLIVESNKGCLDTVFANVEVRDKPPIALPFRDTLICSIDTLMLNAIGNGIFSWGPSYNIINANSQTPLVYPKQTTFYKTTLNENGCINTDSIRVRVVDFVTLNAGADTTICTTDTIRLNPIGDGLKYVWTPANSLNNPNIKNPLANPLTTTRYFVTASIGKCDAFDNVEVRAVPYPGSIAGEDTVICYDDTAQLDARIIGSRFEWSPVNTLSSGNILNPQAFPLRTTTYMLRAYDTLGCPKPGISTVTVTVRPKILSFAGNDTAVVVGQPLQLRGTGAEFFEWMPSTYLNNSRSQTPIANLSDNFTYQLRAFTAEGCFGLDTINIKVFKTAPDIFVPNAFAPTGRNSVLRPICVGISSMEYFRVFNRWGQLVFQTSQMGRGWNGTIGGQLQGTGTYVWMVKGTDFTGKVIVKKGTATLIR